MKVLRNTLPCFPRPDVGHCRAAWLGLACQGFQSWFSLAKRERHALPRPSPTVVSLMPLNIQKASESTCWMVHFDI